MNPVAVLCGGQGTRLGYEGQKCLVPVAGRPFLHWKLDQLARNGATEFHLLVAHKAADVLAAVGTRWGWLRVYYHFDAGVGREAAHEQADLPHRHWLTYGDCLLDVPLVNAPVPFVYSNAEFDDAGVMLCWGPHTPSARLHTLEPSYHINTPADLEKTGAYLHRFCGTR